MIKLIAKYILELYKFHEYDINEKKLLRLAEIIYDANPSVDERTIKQFFRYVNQGQYGTLYRVPTSLTSMYYQFRKDNKWTPKDTRDDFGVIPESCVPMPDSFKKKFGIK